jgi:hypothetical protein
VLAAAFCASLFLCWRIFCSPRTTSSPPPSQVVLSPAGIGAAPPRYYEPSAVCLLIARLQSLLRCLL